MASLHDIRHRLKDAMDRAYEEPGGWMSTASGGFWFFNEPNALDLNVLDVAYGLARQTRYNGQYGIDIDFYSVSEHSRLMLQAIQEESPVLNDHDVTEMLLEDALAVLLHDMPEDVIGDMLTMLKARFPSYRPFEDEHFRVRFSAFLPNPEGVVISKKAIKDFDIRIRMNERDALIVEPSATVGRNQERLPWTDGTPKRLNVKIEGNLPPKEAKLFLETFANVLESYPARMPENAVENNIMLLRHYAVACEHLKRDMLPEFADAMDRFLSAERDQGPQPA